jgi:two-component system OmpR family response regulator
MINNQLLVVEDEAAIAELLSINLRHAGFNVATAATAEAAREAVDRELPSLVVLDWMLPDRSGIALCRQWRGESRTRDLPVIMLTARAEEADQVQGLEAGADDYLVKPFSPRTLVARVRAVLRRTMMDPGDSVAAARRLRFAGWSLDLKARELTSPAGAIVDLSGAEHDLLLAFLEHPQRVLSREQLMEVAKRRMSVDASDRAVDVQVSRLRRKIEPDETSPAIIKTVRGSGYVFVPTVTRE